MNRHSPSILLTVALLALATACGSSAKAASAPTTNAPAASGVSLAGICPKTITVETAWYPEVEEAVLFQLAGSGGKVDAGTKSYTAPMRVNGQPTGVNLRISASAVASGQVPLERMYEDKNVLLGMVGTDDAIDRASKLKSVAVFAPLDTSPLSIGYDATQYHFTTLNQIGQSGLKIVQFPGETWSQYLVSKGIIKAAQIDQSNNGSPDRFVASGGKVTQTVFSMDEPYQWSHELPQWNKPVGYVLISSAGYKPYYGALAVRPDALTQNKACLQKLVPMLQRSMVDYVKSPDATNKLIVDVVKKLQAPWVYSAQDAAYGVKTAVAAKNIANSPDGAIGGFDIPRVEQLISQLRPLAAQNHQSLPANLTAAAIATNQFLDPAIHLP